MRGIVCRMMMAFALAGLAACAANGTTPGAGIPIAPSASADSTAAVVAMIRQAARPITGSERDYDPLLAMIGDARFVLLGDATHGTHEFYAERSRITRRLIEEKGFSAVALEGDWPFAGRVHQFIRGQGSDPAAAQALAGFRGGFPQWMWSNAEMAGLITWMRERNARSAASHVGFYGLDVYTMYESAEAVERYLAAVDPAAARVARQ
ncbi:MAG TPA: erythromycin esterase family protein, partial [Longimicrobium sp.]